MKVPEKLLEKVKTACRGSLEQQAHTRANARYF
jgi:hypothetical protein